MKTLATLALLLTFASTASAGVIYDESVNGDLSTNAAAPTLLVFPPGGSTIIGSVANSAAPGGDRDFITFTIPAGQTLVGLNLLILTPDNLAFIAFNAGSTGLVPSGTTNNLFLAGIHISSANAGTDLMPLFVSSSVTTNALPAPQLGPGTYSFVIQQTTNIVQSYAMEFVVDGGVPTQPTTWGAIKTLYR